jgi:hypothetical protein
MRADDERVAVTLEMVEVRFMGRHGPLRGLLALDGRWCHDVFEAGWEGLLGIVGIDFGP